MGKFKFDDVPTFGHAILDRQRELLKYARIVEWELPKLEGECCQALGDRAVNRGGTRTHWTIRMRRECNALC